MDLGQQLTTSSLAELLGILDKCGQKSLVIDRALSPLVSAISPFSVLKAHGVEQIHWLDQDLVPLQGNIIYLAPNRPDSIAQVARHARASIEGAHLRLISVPSSSLLVEWMLEEQGVLGDITVYHWNASFANMGANMSLFLPCNDQDLVSASATALADLQRRYGTFGRISGFGPRAEKVHALIKDRAGEYQAADAETGGFEYQVGNTFVGSHVDHLILIDRNIDQVTPLLSQLTYQGLIDDRFGISSPMITEIQGQKIKLSDPLFPSLADLNFGNVGSKLNADARQLQAEVDATHQAKSVSEIKDYVSQKLEHHQVLKQSLRTHTGITESLMTYVKSKPFVDALALEQELLANQLSSWNAVTSLQQLIYQGCPASTAFRLACLVCVCRNGIKEKYLHMLYDDLLRTYGYQYIQVIQQLEEAKLLGTKPASVAFTSLARSLKLNCEGSLSEPYAGYVPLTTRLVQNLLSGNGDTKQAGEFFDTIQKSENAREAKLRRILLRNTPGREHPVVLIMFIGGVTYSEAASMRLLEAELKHELNVIVASTGMLNARDIVTTSR